MGIRHVVLFKFRDGVDWSDPRAKEAEAATREHPRHIPEIVDWQCGRNVTERSIAHDFALVGDFADREAVARYLVHPDHLRGVALWRAIADWSVVDFEVNDPVRDERPGADG
ncbi:Dabb family protein [Streptomyces sp. 3MP-14]|uniref:Dabb family protein n=1 Tax=Streptomyces mimosae TaxID=2586635 RepID=A0A5N6ASC2_9ACTN|nr:Dabb family protein [Streptomyces mimosae]KAB8179646.1 Dabb family protein [Streptomyces sp. 3MP-14]